MRGSGSLLDLAFADLGLVFTDERGRRLEPSEGPYQIVAMGGSIVRDKVFGIEREAGGPGAWVRVSAVRFQEATALRDAPHVFMIFTDITKRMVALRESEERFRAVVESAPHAIFIQTNTRFAYVNPAAVALFGATDERMLLGQPVADMFALEGRDVLVTRFRGIEQDQLSFEGVEQRVQRLDGHERDVEFSGVPNRHGGEDGVLVFAHDLNNILMVQRSICETLRLDLHADDPVAQGLSQIDEYVGRAATLTRQLLAFGRKQAMSVQPVDLNVLVSNLEDMLSRLLGEDVELLTVCGDEPAIVDADPGQIDGNRRGVQRRRGRRRSCVLPPSRPSR